MSLHWQPTADLNTLRLRAKVYAIIRQFFAERNIWEVDTPLLAQTSVTACYIDSFALNYFSADSPNKILYLQTSPEYAMKRLLAAGSGSIYQLTKAFREEASGRMHQPEFSMLEWYRVDTDVASFMDELYQLVCTVFATANQHTLPSPIKLTYQQLFLKYLNIDPLTAKTNELIHCATRHGIATVAGLSEEDRDGWLSLLMSHMIEPKLQEIPALFIEQFPASQAALAKLHPEDNRVALRFEFYLYGVELANGFHELTDKEEQEKRFVADNANRLKMGKPEIPIDHYLLAALEYGLPNCVGVALGIDRLLMSVLGKTQIREVIAFPIDVA